MNHEVTAALDVLNARVPGVASAEDVVAPDAIVQLGNARDDVSTRVVNGFSPLIPFDALECAFLSDDGTTLVSYWSRADRALYTAKAHGRNQCVMATDAVSPESSLEPFMASGPETPRRNPTSAFTTPAAPRVEAP